MSVVSAGEILLGGLTGTLLSIMLNRIPKRRAPTKRPAPVS
ncbi:hypothetical protein ACQEVF_52795 [Nonomuraea polychroma]